MNLSWGSNTGSKVKDRKVDIRSVNDSSFTCVRYCTIARTFPIVLSVKKRSRNGKIHGIPEEKQGEREKKKENKRERKKWIAIHKSRCLLHVYIFLMIQTFTYRY